MIAEDVGAGNAEDADLSQPIGWPVRRSGPARLHAVAAALVTKQAPCYGNYSKDVPRCRDECLLRDNCRVSLGTYAFTQVASLIAAEENAPPQAAALNPATPPGAWKKGVNRLAGRQCEACVKPVEVGEDCFVLKANKDVVRHAGCGEPNGSP